MSLRDEWVFEYVASEVAKAAQAKADYHARREAWWSSERELVVADLKDSGLEITEYEVTGGQRHDVQFDPKLTKRLSECAAKIGSHQRSGTQFRMYAEVLAAHPDKHLDLHPADVDYFGLVPALVEGHGGGSGG